MTREERRVSALRGDVGAIAHQIAVLELRVAWLVYAVQKGEPLPGFIHDDEELLRVGPP